MLTEQRKIDGREFWFSIEQPCEPDPESGELMAAPGYYVAFSAEGPPPGHLGDILKDDRNRARIFPSPKAALAAGIKEVKARIGFPETRFAVGLPGGTKQPEFDAYVLLLREEGIDPEAQPRVPDSFGRKWIHVWDTREAAERFATRLRKETGNRGWEVYELSPPRARSAGEADRAGPIEILVGRHSDGNSYALDPKSLNLLRQRFPQAELRPTLFIGRETRNHHQSAVGRVYDQVASLLTGLSREELLEAFGGYRVVDPVSNLTLWEARVDDRHEAAAG